MIIVTTATTQRPDSSSFFNPYFFGDFTESNLQQLNTSTGATGVKGTAVMKIPRAMQFPSLLLPRLLLPVGSLNLPVTSLLL